MVRSRTYLDCRDETLFPFKVCFSIRTMVGAGVLLGTFLPHMYAVALGGIMLCGAILSPMLSKLGLKEDPMTKTVVRGRKMAKINGDFVVFHIGARANAGPDAFFKWMGDAMDAMLDELEKNPALGYLGGESFVGSASQGPMIVQYWRSMEALNAYARNTNHKHAGPWSELMKMGRETSKYGFWHETFHVKEGAYESIFVNCPPIMIGNCHEVELEQVEGMNNTAAGRAGLSKMSDYPEHIGKPDY